MTLRPYQTGDLTAIAGLFYDARFKFFYSSFQVYTNHLAVSSLFHEMQ